MSLPTIALSVRQPWAWAICHAGKDIENRSMFAVRKGRLEPKSICIHASKGLTQSEYDSARHFMSDLGVVCPAPSDLARGGIIGKATITTIVKESDSPWFMGPRGLVLTEALPVTPIPCLGALGFFTWHEAGSMELPKPWMERRNLKPSMRLY